MHSTKTSSLSVLIVLLLSFIALAAEVSGQSFKFRNVGPTRGGRVTAVCGVNQLPNRYYMGASGGGLWQTDNYGKSWKNISDGYFATPSIGAIAVYQNNPDIIYVGTGSDAIRSNVIVGKGMYKSTDAGKTWQPAGLTNAGQIGAVRIHPNNPDVAYVAVVGQPFRKSAQRGVYKTTNGGQTWQQVLYHSDSVGAVDVEFAPDNPEVVYATMYRVERKPWTIISGGATDGIFKSTDGGANWSRLTEGLPTAIMGKIDVAVSAARPERVWALVEAAEGQAGIYKSDNYGQSWQKASLPERIETAITRRPFYFTNLHANPLDADHIWSGAVRLYTSYNGGKSWKQINPPHGDHQDFWMNPTDTALIVVGNDGGASVSTDGGNSWSTQCTQPTAEMDACDVDDQDPFYIYSGQQDNSTIRVPSRPPGMNVLTSTDAPELTDLVNWERVGGCETGPAIPKPGNPDIVYTNCKGRFSVYNHRLRREHNYYVGAESLYGNHPDDVTYRMQRVTPMEVSPHNPEKVYYGSQYLHQTVNGGRDWTTISPDLTANDPQFRMRSGGPINEDITGEEYYAVLYAIQESPVQEGVIWTGANDGLVQVTQNGGQTWANVTPEAPAGGRVQNLEASPHSAGKAYVAINRDYLGDDATYFYKTTDYGQSWQLITTGITANEPARVIREDPNRAGLLFAGTEFGLYVSFNDGANWQSFQKNLPVVPIADMQVYRKNLVVATLGRSFWVLDDISPLHQLTDEQPDQLHVFEPRPAYTANQLFYFTLPSELTDTVVKFKFMKNGQTVHQKEEQVAKLTADQFGLRRTTWDLRWYFKRPGERDLRGPMAAPGTYTVEVSYGAATKTTTFELLLHPELAAFGTTPQDLQQQEALALQVAGLLQAVNQRIKTLEGNVEAAKGKKAKAKLTAQLAQLKKGPNPYDKPGLADQVRYLYYLCTAQQQPLGSDAANRYQQLTDAWQALQ